MSETALPVEMASPAIRQWSPRSVPKLYRLARGQSVAGYFAEPHCSRLIVVVHWDRERGVSFRCPGADSCSYCSRNQLGESHLYCGLWVYDHDVSHWSRWIVALGTVRASAWAANCPDFKQLAKVSRDDKNGHIKVSFDPYSKTRPAALVGWDIRSDVDRVFTGRVSNLEVSND